MDNIFNDAIDEAERKARQNDLKVQEEKRQKQIEEERKNSDFTQVYKKYWKFIQNIIDENPKAAILYNFLAEHAAPDTGAVVVSQQILADKMGVSRMTISRHIKYLEKKNMILKISLSGGVCAYALDPEMVWKSYSTNKEYATFKTKTLVKKIDMEKNEIHRKLNVMLKEQRARIEEIDTSEQYELSLDDLSAKIEDELRKSD